MKRWQQIVPSTHSKHVVPALIVAISVAVIGTYSLSFSHAATTAVSTEAESGLPSNGATVTSDTSASGGAAMLFGSAAANSIAVGIAVDDPNTANNPELSNYSAAAGKSPAFVEWYQSWAEPLYYTSQKNVLVTDNLTPVISWTSNSTPLTSISNGSQNSTIDAAAALAKQWPGTLYIRFDYEMNVASSAWDPANLSETPADYISAWQYIVNRFKNTDGVTNVKWVWSPNVDCNGSCPFDAYYPGSSYVDMVGLDGYNYASLDNVSWQSFSSLFQNGYNDLTALAPGKPVDIAEVGSAEPTSSEITAGDSKATWVEQMATTIPTAMPKVTAITWWEGASDQSSLEIQSSTSAINTWISDVVTDQNYQGRLP